MAKFKLKSYHASEAQIKKVITDYLTILENQGKLMFLRNNSFAGIIKSGGRESFIINGKKGSSDLLIFLDGGITIHCEVKSVIGVVSEDQQIFSEKLKKLGHTYIIIHSLQELIDFLKM